MSKEDIDRAVKDAEKYAEEDRKLKDLVDAKNKAESYTLNVEKQLDELGDKVSESEKQEIKDELEKLKEAVKTDDIDRIKAATEEFEKKYFAMGEKLYKNQGGEANGGATQNEDGSYNADFTDNSNQ